MPNAIKITLFSLACAGAFAFAVVAAIMAT